MWKLAALQVDLAGLRSSGSAERAVLPALRAHRRDRDHQAVAALSYVDPDADVDARHVHALPTQSDPHTHVVSTQSDPHTYVVSTQSNLHTDAIPTQSNPHAYTVPAYPHSHGDADSLHADALANQYTPADKYACPAYANVGQTAPAQPGPSPRRAASRGM
jgi:hypothetical protein